MMIAETKLPHPRRLEGLALLGSTHSYHFVATKKNAGADPSSAGDEKEANAKRVKGEPCVPKLDPNTRQRKGDPKW